MSTDGKKRPGSDRNPRRLPRARIEMDPQPTNGVFPMMLVDVDGPRAGQILSRRFVLGIRSMTELVARPEAQRAEVIRAELRDYGIKRGYVVLDVTQTAELVSDEASQIGLGSSP